MKISFLLGLENEFISKNIEYYIAGKFSPVDSKKSYNEKSNIKMVDSLVVHVSHQLEVRNSTIIDEIKVAVIASMVKGCVCYSGVDIYIGETENSGFRAPIHEGQNFEAVGKLGDLGLGFYNDYNAPFHWKSKKADGTEDDSTLPGEGKVIIDTFYFRMPIIEYNNEAKANLINELFNDNYFNIKNGSAFKK